MSWGSGGVSRVCFCPLFGGHELSPLSRLRCLLHDHKFGAETATGSKVHVWMRLGPGRKAGTFARRACFSSQRCPH
jgi:hypothetical protein